jgi:hypothetical protein
LNLTKLNSGGDFAHHVWRGNKRYVERADRVRVVRTFQKMEGGNTSGTGYAEVLYMSEDGSDFIHGPGVTREVRARDIFMTWDEYEAERAVRSRQKREREHEARLRLAARQQKEAAIRDGLTEKGLTPRSINIYTVEFDRSEIERWLGIESTVTTI